MKKQNLIKIFLKLKIIEDLENKCKELEEINERLQKKHVDLLEKYNKFKVVNEESAEQMRRNYEKIASDYKILKEKERKLIEENENIVKKNGNLQEITDGLMGEKKKLEENEERLKEELQNLSDKEGKLTKENEELKQMLSKLQFSNKNLIIEKNSAVKEKEKALILNKEINSENEKIKENYKVKSEEYDDLLKRYEKIQKEYTLILNDNETLKEEFERLSVRHNLLKNDNKEKYRKADEENKTECKEDRSSVLSFDKDVLSLNSEFNNLSFKSSVSTKKPKDLVFVHNPNNSSFYSSKTSSRNKKKLTKKGRENEINFNLKLNAITISNLKNKCFKYEDNNTGDKSQESFQFFNTTLNNCFNNTFITRSCKEFNSKTKRSESLNNNQIVKSIDEKIIGDLKEYNNKVMFIKKRISKLCKKNK